MLSSPLPEFWIYARNDYHALVGKTLICLMSFATTYSYEASVSVLKICKIKHMAHQMIEIDIRIALTNVQPRIKFFTLYKG